MITPLPELQAMTKDQLIERIMRAELAADNALFHARAQEQFAAQARFDSETLRLIELGRKIQTMTGSPACV